MTLRIFRARVTFLGRRGAPVFSFLFSIFVVALASTAIPALGADDADYPFADMSLKELMALKVFSSASLTPTQISKAPGTAYSFDREDFERLGARRLDDLLRLTPGIQLNQYRKRHNAIWARGVVDRYNDKMTLFIDRIPVRSLYYGHFSAGENISLENIEKVEILLGPASSLYGANAFGGVISLTTRNFSESSSISATSEGASNNRGKAAGLYRDEWLTVFGSHLAQDASYSEDRKSFTGAETVQPLNEDHSWLYVKAKPFEGLTLIANYQQNNMPFLFMAPTQAAFIEERPLTLAAKYEHGDIEHGRLEVKIHYSIHDTMEYYTENSLDGVSYTENQNGQTSGATATYFKRLGERHNITLGASVSQGRAENMDYSLYWHYKRGLLDTPESGSLLSDPQAVYNDYAAYAQYVWNASDSLSVTLGGRFDGYSVFGNHLSYRSAMVWTPSEEQVVKLLYGTAIRTPVYREYLKVMEDSSFVPPVPAPEGMRTIEVGYSYQWDTAALGLTAFRNFFEHYIQETSTPNGGDEYFSNSGDEWIMSGLEALLQIHPTHDLHVRLSATYIDAERADTGKLPYLAQLTGGLAVDYQYLPSHFAGFTLYHYSDRKDTNDYTDDDSGAFFMLSVTAFGRITDRLGYSIGADNLLDERVYDPAADFSSRHNTEKTRREIWLKLEYSLDGGN
ncbi:MAG: TonB-dependent receptor [Nitrospinota bacterium]|nr:TonB-dependent receptor [Nitrospinota bacterium]